MTKLDKHIWEGWTVRDFINALEDEINMIMTNHSYIEPFENKDALAKYCADNQPYYKKRIPEVINYFANKYNIK